ncbi:MAG: 2,3,4,5-tetrahydropyridine-2,6-dicarboxylate N-succinyltransferase [Ilumatobacteraceae bacterium]
MTASVQQRIDDLWTRRTDPATDRAEIRAAAVEAIELLDDGSCRVADVVDDEVIVHEWLKRAILLYFVAADDSVSQVGPFQHRDRVPLASGLGARGVRAVPGSIVRWGAHVEPGCVLMPCFVNIGARVGAGSMVDTWATVGSCAQVGRNVHISGGVGLGGVLEPPQAAPVVIEDDAFVGSRSMITEGARVGRGAMLGAGVILNPSVPVIDAETGLEVSRGVVPAWSLVINATRPRDFPGGTFGLPCALDHQAVEGGAAARQGRAQRPAS